MVGERLREVRQRRQLSLQEVAAQAKISAATLSRIETSKQAVDVSTLLQLSDILGCRAATLVEDGGAHDERTLLIEKLSTLDSASRMEIWRGLAEERRSRDSGRKGDTRQLSGQIDELLAQLDLLRAEIELLRQRFK